MAAALVPDALWSLIRPLLPASVPKPQGGRPRVSDQLNTSAMAVSRWERGEAEPSAEAYIRLGHLAGDPLCWFFGGVPVLALRT
jgi:hypothetical protein